MTEGRPIAGLGEFRKISDQVRNWGRWGADDELGTLNFITDAKVREGASLVRRGKVFPLGLNFGSYGPQPDPFGFRRNPIHLMTLDGGDSHFVDDVAGWGQDPGAELVVSLWESDLARFNDDYIIMPLQCATQWDALSHIYYEEKLYNGYPASSVTSFGATKLAIDKADARGITTRGVLVDVVRYREEHPVDPRTPITPDELDAVLATQDTEVRSGDVVIVRTGSWQAFRHRAGPHEHPTGLSWRCAPWLHRHEIAAVAADNIAVEALGRHVDGAGLPLHLLCLRDMGMMFGEMWFLDDLAEDCAGDAVYEFQIVAPPLRVTGGVGSPLNPIALK